MSYKHKVPNLAEIQSDISQAVDQDKLNYICNQPVPKDWIKGHPILRVKNEKGESVKLPYLPVEKVEYLLTRIFGRWRREIKEVKQLGNSIMVIVRLWVWNPNWDDWDWHDGIGAVALQTDAGAGAFDINAMKSNAVQIGAPAATSFALKNAAERFGQIFGRNLEKGHMEFAGTYANVQIEYPDTPGNGLPAATETIPAPVAPIVATEGMPLIQTQF